MEKRQLQTVPKPRGRRKKYAEYEELLKSLPKGMKKRPVYLNGIGLFNGQRGVSVWLKITLKHGGTYQGKSYAPGASVEIRLGKLSSWSWEQLEAERDKLVGRAERNEPLEGKPTYLFKDYAEKWLSDHDEFDSRDIAVGHLKNSLLPAFGEKVLGSITLEDVNQWQVRQRKKSLRPSTIMRQRSTLNSILNYAKNNNLIDYNPCAAANKIKGIQPRLRILTLEEATQLILASRNYAPWFPDFLLWLLHSGMRRGEALALKWEHVQVLPNQQKLILIEKTKTKKPRQIHCTQEMIEILDRQEASRVGDESRVFPISLSTLKRKWNALRKDQGIADIRLHDLRRTHSTLLTYANVDMRTVAGRLGHRDLKMLQEVYAVFMGDKHAAEAAQKIFGGIRMDEIDETEEELEEVSIGEGESR